MVGVTVVLMLLSFDSLGTVLARNLEKRYPVQPAHHYYGTKYIVSLGGGSVADPSLPTASQLHRATLGRVTSAVILYRELQHQDSTLTLITTGGALFDTVTIAELSQEVAMQLGVDSSHILMADNALDTPMEALAVKKMVGDNPIILVTSALHLPRATYLFEKAGVEVLPYPVDFRVKKGPWSPGDMFPNAHRLALSRDAIHEYVGMIRAKLLP